jgi:magnesium transporter
MRTIYKSTEHGLVTIPDIIEGCWVHVTRPEPQDAAWLESLGLPGDFLTHATDLDERPRAERDNGAVLIVLRFPYAQGPQADIPFTTVPLTVIVTEQQIVTITPQSTGFLQKFADGHVRGLTTGKRTRFILHLFLHIANQYLQAIEMSDISQNILSSMMDAFASIISNNLNVVMKFMASATIVISLPTLIASFYGMNVPLPGGGHPLAFPVALGVSLLIAGLVVVVFWRKDWL